MKYCFILGTNPALSVAELGAVLNLQEPRLLAPDFLLAEVAEVDADKLIRRLGGTIKIGRIAATIKTGNDLNLLQTIFGLIDRKRSTSGEGKFNFGLSDYGKRHFNKKDIGLKIKKAFQDEGISTRFVVSQEKTLSSVVVTQNKLLGRGIEILLAGDGDEILIGETLSVQDFKDLSRRDYGRPGRDDRSGMLPPKLAQVMLNLASGGRINDVILDPFCGSGTVLTEALLLGYRRLYGLDISPVAVADTRKNISWIEELYKLDRAEIGLAIHDATKVADLIGTGKVDAIVTEPFLGPQRGQLELPKVVVELNGLYSAALKQFAAILKPGKKVVMIWPLFYGERQISPQYAGFKIINPLPASLRSSRLLEISKRNTIIYGRPGQKVYREIVLLERE